MAYQHNSTHQPALRGGMVLIVALVTALVTISRVQAQDPILDAYSQEVVVVNSEAAPVLTEAYSKEAVLVASELPPALTEVYSKEAVLVASEVAPVLTETYSKEAVLVASELPPLLTEAYSKEAVLVVSESPIVDTFSREIAIYDGYYVTEAFDALRIAGGIQTATADNMNRFALALQLTNATRINLPVAVRILRIATRLQP